MFKSCLAAFALLMTVFTVKGETIHITNGEWEPYLSEVSPHYGVASHIVEEAFNQVGIRVHWGFFPWVRSYEQAKEGKDWQASAVWWPTEDANKHFLLSVPVVHTSNVFFHLKSRPIKWNTFSDLSGLKIGITRGYDYGSDFNLAVKRGELDVQEVSSDEINLKKLLSGRIDLFPNDPDVGFAQIRNNYEFNQANQFAHHKKKFARRTLHLLISKKAKRADYFMEAFNKGIGILADQGKIKKMLNQLKDGYYDQKNIKDR